MSTFLLWYFGISALVCILRGFLKARKGEGVTTAVALLWFLFAPVDLCLVVVFLAVSLLAAVFVTIGQNLGDKTKGAE